MDVKLRRIKTSGRHWDDLLNSIVDTYKETNEIIVDQQVIEDASETITIDGKELIVEVNLMEYEDVIKNFHLKQEIKPKIGMLLFKDFTVTKNGLMIPVNLLYDEAVWAYLSLTLFKNLVGKMFSFKDTGVDEEKVRDKIKNGIKRIYFNSASRTGVPRTGLRSIWIMMDMLDVKDDYEFNKVAYEFIDAVKAVFERKMSNNPYILKAFVQGIINNGKNAKFRDKKMRNKIPSHISCFSAVNFLDAYDYDELVEVITEQQKIILEF